MDSPDVTPATLRPFVVTVRCFDPAVPQTAIATYELPVDSPDAEHAVTAAMSNAVGFTVKTAEGMSLRSVAFAAVEVRLR